MGITMGSLLQCYTPYAQTGEALNWCELESWNDLKDWPLKLGSKDGCKKRGLLHLKQFCSMNTKLAENLRQQESKSLPLPVRLNLRPWILLLLHVRNHEVERTPFFRACLSLALIEWFEQCFGKIILNKFLNMQPKELCPVPLWKKMND